MIDPALNTVDLPNQVTLGNSYIIQSYKDDRFRSGQKHREATVLDKQRLRNTEMCSVGIAKPPQPPDKLSLEKMQLPALTLISLGLLFIFPSHKTAVLLLDGKLLDQLLGAKFGQSEETIRAGSWSELENISR